MRRAVIWADVTKGRDDDEASTEQHKSRKNVENASSTHRSRVYRVLYRVSSSSLVYVSGLARGGFLGDFLLAEVAVAR